MAPMPEELQRIHEELKEKCGEAAENSRYGIAQVGQSVDQAAQYFAYACELDRGWSTAQIGLGYCNLILNIRSINDIFANISADKTIPRIINLEDEWRRVRKQARLRSLCDMLGKPFQPLSLPIQGKEGTVNGLFIGKDGARASGIIGKIGILSHGTAVQPVQDKNMEWKEMMEYFDKVKAEYQTTPVILADYSRKDYALLISAIQTYKWIHNIDPSCCETNGLTIEMHDFTLNFYGDSAGVAMAIAGYSSLKHRQIRQDIAVTGSIRSDGAVKAVGGVCEKIIGALNADLIETVIVPWDNDADLLSLTPNTLCKLTIIKAENMDQYLKYALVPQDTVIQKDEIKDKDMTQLIKRITYSDDPVSQYIKTHLSPDTVKMLEPILVGTNAPTPAVATNITDAILKDINNLLSNETFYSSNRFAQIQLSPETKTMLQKKMTPGRVERLNRLLIEDAYPELIAPCTEGYLLDDPIEMLQEAQVLILMGKMDEARPMLEEVESRCPEIYNAPRLLDLMDIYTKPKPATPLASAPVQNTSKK